MMSKLYQDSRLDFDPGSGNTFIWKGPIDDERPQNIKTDNGIHIYRTIRLGDGFVLVECFTQNRWMKCVTVFRSLLGDKRKRGIDKALNFDLLITPHYFEM